MNGAWDPTAGPNVCLKCAILLSNRCLVKLIFCLAQSILLMR
jgi:hypothetical protein